LEVEEEAQHFLHIIYIGNNYLYRELLLSGLPSAAGALEVEEEAQIII
jgi:hypothetical protein